MTKVRCTGSGAAAQSPGGAAMKPPEIETAPPGRYISPAKKQNRGFHPTNFVNLKTSNYELSGSMFHKKVYKYLSKEVSSPTSKSRTNCHG